MGKLGLRQVSYCVQMAHSGRDKGGVQTQAATLLLAPEIIDWASWKPQIPSHQPSPQVHHSLVFPPSIECFELLGSLVRLFSMPKRPVGSELPGAFLATVVGL